MKVAIKGAFEKVKEELDEHRDAINDNTNELHSNYEYLVSLENKIDKLQERIDDLYMMFQGSPQKPKIMLTSNEQKVFMQLYTSEDYLWLGELAAHLEMPRELVEECIKTMCTKGVNLTTAYRGTKAYVRMDPAFRDEQAKQNIIQITHD